MSKICETCKIGREAAHRVFSSSKLRITVKLTDKGYGWSVNGSDISGYQLLARCSEFCPYELERMMEKKS